ncbi:hypothetical protein X745_13745 [Mesorhizobium sp. LNJC374B00]|nr:hypothetical protein X745_13745 [Mesorhizobium sp. LNJC374B00]
MVGAQVSFVAVGTSSVTSMVMVLVIVLPLASVAW